MPMDGDVYRYLNPSVLHILQFIDKRKRDYSKHEEAMPVPLGLLRLSLISLSAVLLVMRHFLHPRLPVYRLQLKYNALPQFIKSPVTLEWQLVMATQVQFYNANYLHLTVHALTFDLYLEDVVSTMPEEPSWRGNSLLYMGTITDPAQHCLAHRPDTTVLWSIRARSNFTIDHCPLHMSVQGSSLKWRSLLQILIRWWRHTFQNDLPFTLPTTGVAHIRASSFPPPQLFNASSYQPGLATALSSIPVTVGIICDNTIDLWRMEVIGTDCVMRSMLPGWVPLNTSVLHLRKYAVSKLRVHPDTGSVIPHPILSMPSLADLMSTLAWEEALQHL
jgi:hypothetical protein